MEAHSDGHRSDGAAQGPCRKRRRIADSDRQRSSIACSNCRRLKEKCDGKIPCERCTRHNRRCEVKPAPPRRESPGTQPQLGNDDAERLIHLEAIARNYLGDIPLTAERLRRVVQNLQTQQANEGNGEPADAAELALEEARFTVRDISQNTAHYSGELSHWNFSQRIRDQVDRRLRKNTYQDFPVLEFWRAGHLSSADWTQLFNKQNLPSWDIALFLTQIYFEYAQINDYFVGQEWLYEKLGLLYSFNQRLTAEDAAWITIVLMTMAVGSQFVHMTDKNPEMSLSTRNNEHEATENAIGMTLFHLSSKLVPDMIAVASVEGMQAFMLLAHFALPLDTPGVAYTYVGIALKMAIQNGLHRAIKGSDLSDATLDFRNRLFWTAYRLDTRISVLHGRPISIATADIDVAHPMESSVTDTPEEAALRTRENIATQLTEWLLDFANSIHMLRRCPKRLRSAYLDRIMQTRRKYKSWWISQPISKTPKQKLARPDAHTHLCYQLNLVFMGRNFIFTDATESQHSLTSRSSHSARNELVEDAVSAAFEITDLCAALDSCTGLARASYVEFSSVRAALLVMLAQSLNERSQELSDKLSLGMGLIRSMAVGILSTRSEASIIGAIEAAIQQLGEMTEAPAQEQDPAQSTSGQNVEGNYQKWTSLWQDPQESNDNVEAPSPLPSAIDPSDMRDFMGDFDWSPFDPSLFESDFAGMSSMLPISHSWSVVPPDLNHSAMMYSRDVLPGSQYVRKS